MLASVRPSKFCRKAWCCLHLGTRPGQAGRLWLGTEPEAMKLLRTRWQLCTALRLRAVRHVAACC